MLIGTKDYAGIDAGGTHVPSARNAARDDPPGENLLQHHMNDLGTTRKSPGLNAPSGPMEADQPRIEYPTINFNGDQAAAAGLGKCAIGDEYEITVKIRATRLGGDSWEMERSNGKPPASFEVVAADKPKKVESGDDAEEMEDEDEGAEEKPKKKPKVKSPLESGFKDAYKGEDDE